MQVAGPNYLNDAMDIVLEAESKQREGTMTKQRFLNICQAAGLNANRHGLLACRELREVFNPTVHCRFDWCHTFLQDGVLTNEMWLFLHALEKK